MVTLIVQAVARTLGSFTFIFILRDRGFKTVSAPQCALFTSLSSCQASESQVTDDSESRGNNNQTDTESNSAQQVQRLMVRQF